VNKLKLNRLFVKGYAATWMVAVLTTLYAYVGWPVKKMMEEKKQEMMSFEIGALDMSPRGYRYQFGKCNALYIFQLISVFLFIAFGVGSAIASDDCSEGDQLSQVQCLSLQIQLLDKNLNTTYRRALDMLPEKNGSDTRKEREQLRRSQRAWLKFKNENCALVGGLRGGSNLSISHFAALCEKQAIEERINFLEQIAQQQNY